MPPRKNNAPALVAAASTAEVPSAVEAQEPEAVAEPHILTDIDRLMRGGGQDERALPLYLQDWAKTIELLKAPFIPTMCHSFPRRSTTRPRPQPRQPMPTHGFIPHE